MPTYEWRCCDDKCAEREELYLKHIIRDDERIRKCPKCGKDMLLETFSPSDIRFCEKGRYIQDRGFSNDSLKYNFSKLKDAEIKKKHATK